MTLDISKIKCEKLKDLANKRDINKTGKLEESEFILFKLEAEQIRDYGKGVSAKEFKETMGLYQTAPTDATSAKPVAETKNEADVKTRINKSEWTKGQVNKWNKEEEEAFVRKLDDIALNGYDKNTLIQALADVNNKELVKVATELLNKMPNYESVKDVEKNHDEIMKQARKDTVDNDLQRKILNALEENSKSKIKNELKADLLKIFEAKVQDAAKKDINVTQESIMAEIKEALKDAKTFKQEYRDVFKAFEDDTIMKNARKNICNAIYQDIDDTKWRKIKRSAKETLKEDNQWDKYNKEALTKQKFGDKISGKKRYGRIAAENQATENNVRQNVIQNHKDVAKELGKKMDVFVALEEAGLVKQTSDGKWDLTELSAIIGTQVGADNRLNRHAKIDEAISEKLRTTGKVALESKLNSLTEEEAKALVKLCGYDIEGKEWGRALLNSALGFITGAGAGAGHEYLNPAKQNGTKITHDLNFTLEITGGGEIGDIGALDGDATVERTGNSIIVNIHQLINIPGKLIRLASRITSAGLTSGLAGAALGFLQGMGDKGEVPVSAINFEEKDIDDYLTRVKKENPAYAEALTPLAMYFVKDGKWDVQAYKSFLNDAAGEGGKLNRDELIGACKELQKNKIEIVKENKEIKQTETPAAKDPEPIQKAVKSEVIPGEKTSITYKRKGGDSWSGLIFTYYPDVLENHSLKEAITALKNALGVDHKANDLPPEAELPAKLLGKDATNRPDETQRGKYFELGERTKPYQEAVATAKATKSEDQYIAYEIGNEQNNNSTGTSEKNAVEKVIDKIKDTLEDGIKAIVDVDYEKEDDVKVEIKKEKKD